MKRYIVAVSAASYLFFHRISCLALILISSGFVVSLYIRRGARRKKAAVHFPNATDSGAKRDNRR